MPEEKNTEVVSLLDCDTFTTKIRVSLPGKGADVRRPFEFDAEMELIDQDEYEDLVANSTKSELLRRLLRRVSDNVPVARDKKTGEELTRVETVIRNQICCEGCCTAYWLYTSEDNRAMIASAAERKNSKRSRKR